MLIERVAIDGTAENELKSCVVVSRSMERIHKVLVSGCLHIDLFQCLIFIVGWMEGIAIY